MGVRLAEAEALLFQARDELSTALQRESEAIAGRSLAEQRQADAESSLESILDELNVVRQQAAELRNTVEVQRGELEQLGQSNEKRTTDVREVSTLQGKLRGTEKQLEQAHEVTRKSSVESARLAAEVTTLASELKCAQDNLRYKCDEIESLRDDLRVSEAKQAQLEAQLARALADHNTSVLEGSKRMEEASARMEKELITARQDVSDGLARESALKEKLIGLERNWEQLRGDLTTRDTELRTVRRELDECGDAARRAMDSRRTAGVERERLRNELRDALAHRDLALKGAVTLSPTTTALSHTEPPRVTSPLSPPSNVVGVGLYGSRSHSPPLTTSALSTSNVTPRKSESQSFLATYAPLGLGCSPESHRDTRSHGKVGASSVTFAVAPFSRAEKSEDDRAISPPKELRLV